MNILIVDDDRSVQRVLSDALTKRGFVVTVERDGEWAVRTFEKKVFDAVILDLLLPALNGYEVCNQIRALPRGKNVPVIMISGIYTNEAHRREATGKHKALALLEKPLDLNLLVDTLRTALGDRYPQPPAPTPPPVPLEEDEITAEFLADDSQRAEADDVERSIPAASNRPKATAHEGPWEHISDKPFAQVLSQTYATRFNGAVRLRRGSVKKIVYFRKGTPELVKSNLVIECLGRVLVGERMISESECEESLRRMKHTGRLQGTVLMEMGCISPHNLQHALAQQLQNKLYDALSWDDGEYQFKSNAPLPAEPISVGMPYAQLIVEGIKKTYDEQRLAKVFHGFDHHYAHPNEDPRFAFQNIGLLADEQELLKMVDGHKTLATLRALAILSPFETDRFLFAMQCAQVLTFKRTPSEGKPRMAFAEVAAAAMPPPLPTPKPEPKPMRRIARQMPPPPPAPSPQPPRREGPVIARSVVGGLLPELSEVVSLPRLSGREGADREKLAARIAAMRKLNYFELLGVQTSASREDIKRAYFSLAKEYHPDKHFSSASFETRTLAQQIYDLIATAHDTLTDPQEKKNYLRDLEAGTERPLEVDVGKILAAEGKFQRGEELVRQRQFAEAYKLFLEAIHLCPDEGEFHAWAGWALFQADPDRFEDAVRSIEQAISLNSKLDKSYLFLGFIQKATGRSDRAERQFEKAIQCNPDCTEALRELRLLGKRR